MLLRRNLRSNLRSTTTYDYTMTFIQIYAYHHRVLHEMHSRWWNLDGLRPSKRTLFVALMLEHERVSFPPLLAFSATNMLMILRKTLTPKERCNLLKPKDSDDIIHLCPTPSFPSLHSFHLSNAPMNFSHPPSYLYSQGFPFQPQFRLSFLPVPDSRSIPFGVNSPVLTLLFPFSLVSISS